MLAGRSVVAMALLVLGGGGQVRAQAVADVAGPWTARWGVGVRTAADGTVSVDREEPAALVLEAAGDSLVGTWTFELPATGRVTWRLHGRARGGRVTLVATEGEMERPPPASQGRLVRLEWTGTLSGGRIEGVHTLVLELPDGRERPSPRPWSAVRAGAGGGAGEAE